MVLPSHTTTTGLYNVHHLYQWCPPPCHHNRRTPFTSFKQMVLPSRQQQRATPFTPFIPLVLTPPHPDPFLSPTIPPLRTDTIYIICTIYKISASSADPNLPEIECPIYTIYTNWFPPSIPRRAYTVYFIYTSDTSPSPPPQAFTINTIFISSTPPSPRPPQPLEVYIPFALFTQFSPGTLTLPSPHKPTQFTPQLALTPHYHDGFSI